MSVRAFYDELAALYHLVYENWEASVARQGTALASLIGEHWGTGARTVLDAASASAPKPLDFSRSGFGWQAPISGTPPSIEPGAKQPRVTFRSPVSSPTFALSRSWQQALTS
jgi:hypothetical protein